ncbi:MAG TPA: gas vesicle protein [Gemmatimonadaceae bacterium]|nr:gas vesicle protein [Gemmatimonadaceae bacterium]
MTRELERDDELVLSELLNHVLDKGVVITGDVTISVADIDLVRVGLSLVLSSVETMERQRAPQRVAPGGNEDAPPVLPDRSPE